MGLFHQFRLEHPYSFEQVVFLVQHGTEYLEVLKKCTFSGTGLWQSKQEAEQTQMAEQRIRKQIDIERKLYNIFYNLSPQELNKYLSKSFECKIRKGIFKDRDVTVPEYFRIEDIPSFLVRKLDAPVPVGFANVPTPAQPFSINDDDELPF